MKVKLSLLLLLTSFCIYAQDLPKAISSNHQQIKGTNVFMIPPKSFELSDNYKGFHNPDNQTSMIMTIEIPGPYPEVAKGFNGEMLKKKGMDLISKKDILVDNYNGLLVRVEQAANGMIFSKHLLIYGDEKFTMMINGVFIKDSTQLGNDILASIMSTFVDSKITINPRNELSYTLDESVSSLKFKSVIGNGMIFNRDLKTPTESFDKATLITDKSFANVVIENKQLFCISRIKKYPEDFSVDISRGVNEIEIDGIKGYELYAKNNDTKDEEIYQVILFDDEGGYYLFVGSYLSAKKETALEIKKIIKTFKRK